MALRVVISGGGTAGHVYPGLALGRALAERGHRVTFVGTERGLEARLVPASGFEFHAVPAAPLARRLGPSAVRAPVVAVGAVRRCRWVLRGADAAVGMGGYASVPAVLAARRERVPTVLHEQNALPGLANRTLSRLARAVALSFPDAARYFPRRTRTELTGNPVRPEIVRVQSERESLRTEALGQLGLEEGRRTVAVFGGSQGALHLNRAAVGACRVLASRSDLQVVLITGPAHLETIARAVPTRPGGILVRLFGFVKRMELVYARADLVVARAGASTVAELTAVGLPALLVPYPYATGGHQEANARALQRTGAASVLLDDQLSADVLASRIESLVDHEERLQVMAERARAFGRPDAAARLADLIEEVAR